MLQAILFVSEPATSSLMKSLITDFQLLQRELQEFKRRLFDIKYFPCGLTVAIDQ